MSKGHEGTVWSAELSPDGQRVVTASVDSTARVWNPDGNGTLVVLKGHKGKVRSATFRADGRRVVTAGDDRTARVWKADGSGAPIVLKGQHSIAWPAAFISDGERAATASIGKARVSGISVRALQDILHTADCLSPQTRWTYLGESGEDAWELHESCERSYGRTPLSSDRNF
ncbi:WD40 repeat domain-containing protein [Sorangium sp. So ce1099]|uniref:WD40 repeat domain-containing protein n=1 Tax=Sorangium sp. So ce1099 TaxID=3133331 RepID=UPI003F5DD0AC